MDVTSNGLDKLDGLLTEVPGFSIVRASLPAYTMTTPLVGGRLMARLSLRRGTTFLSTTGVCDNPDLQPYVRNFA
jgi:hypothetical protein